MICGRGGFVAYLGTNDAYKVELRMMDGDKEAEKIYSAMAYQVSKEIGAMATVLKGDVDAILLTGGIANGKPFVERIIDRVEYIAPIHVYPGEDEMRALAMNGHLILTGEVEAKKYE